MKKVLSLLVLFALIMGSSGALAENWWSAIGPANDAQTQEPTPDPTPEPTEPAKFDLGGLFGSILNADDSQTEELIEAEPTIEPSEEIPVEEGDGYLEDALYSMEVGDITAKPYGGESKYIVIGNWVVAYGNCDDHFCVFGWNELTREYHILAETIVSDIIPVGDSFAYYGEVKSGKFGWLIRNPNEEKPVSLSLNELNSVFWSDENYLYYYTYGKGTGTTYHRMDHNGENKKQLGKLNGRAIAMMADGSVVVFNSSKNLVQLYRDGDHETVYEPEANIQNVVSTGHEIWVVHDDCLGLLRDGELAFRFTGSLRTYAATTDQIIAVLDDGSVRLNVLMLNDVYGAYAVAGEVIAQDSLTAEITPGWYNRIVVWGPRESLEYTTPYSDYWLPYGYYDLESALAAGYRSAIDYGDEQPDIGYTYEDNEKIVRRVSDKLLGEDADVMSDAEQRGIYVAHDRDGMFSYYMDDGQYQALLEERRQGLVALLDIMTLLGDDPTMKTYEASDDYSRITLRVNSALLESDTSFYLMLSAVSQSVSIYQSFLKEEENPVSKIVIVDDATGKEIAAFSVPDDFS